MTKDEIVAVLEDDGFRSTQYGYLKAKFPRLETRGMTQGILEECFQDALFSISQWDEVRAARVKDQEALGRGLFREADRNVLDWLAKEKTRKRLGATPVTPAEGESHDEALDRVSGGQSMWGGEPRFSDVVTVRLPGRKPLRLEYEGLAEYIRLTVSDTVLADGLYTHFTTGASFADIHADLEPGAVFGKRATGVESFTNLMAQEKKRFLAVVTKELDEMYAPVRQRYGYGIGPYRSGEAPTRPDPNVCFTELEVRDEEPTPPKRIPSEATAAWEKAREVYLQEGEWVPPTPPALPLAADGSTTSRVKRMLWAA